MNPKLTERPTCKVCGQTVVLDAAGEWWLHEGNPPPEFADRENPEYYDHEAQAVGRLDPTAMGRRI